MTGYADYLFLLSPPEAIKHEILRYKKASARLIGDYKSMDSPAHISILHIERQKPFFANTTIGHMEKKLYIMPPVLLHVDGFKYFTHLHSKMTIYAHIRSNPAVEAWFTLLKKNLNIKKALVPHITIARDIPEADFNTLWLHFRHKKLFEPFWINELKVVQRETFGSFPKWEKFKTFPFKGTKSFEYLASGVENQAEVKDEPENQINLF
jgi:2'-5' RNA ligase